LPTVGDKEKKRFITLKPEILERLRQRGPADGVPPFAAEAKQDGISSGNYTCATSVGQMTVGRTQVWSKFKQNE